MGTARIAGGLASFVLVAGFFAFVAWWLMWPLWEGPPPAFLPPPLVLISLVLGAFSLLARARARPAGWSSAPALLLILLAATLLIEEAAGWGSGLARVVSPEAIADGSFGPWRPSLVLAGQLLALGMALWSVHGSRRAKFDLGDALVLAALLGAVAALVLSPGPAPVASLLLAVGLLVLQPGRGIFAAFSGLAARRARNRSEAEEAVASRPKPAKPKKKKKAEEEEPEEEPEAPLLAPKPVARKVPMATLPPANVNPKTGLHTEAGWKQAMKEEDERCAVAGASGCVIAFEAKTTDAVLIEEIPKLVKAVARDGDVVAKVDTGYLYLAGGIPPEQAPGMVVRVRNALAKGGVQVWIGMAMRDLHADFPSTAQEAIDAKNQLRASSTGTHQALR